MCIAHVFHGVGNDFAAGEGIEHAVVAHCYAVIDGNGVKLFRYSTSLFDGFFDNIADVFEVYVSGDKIRV